MSRIPKGEKWALPQFVTIGVKTNIAMGCNLYISHMVGPWTKPIDWIMKRCYPEEVLAICKLGYQHTTDAVRRHNTFSIKPLSDVRVECIGQYSEAMSILPPHEGYQIEVSVAVPELVEYCTRVRAILYDYAKVLHVFEWFNKNASGAAMRTYCPWIQSIVPSEYHHLLEGTRFREPAGLASILNLTKEVAGIMTRTLLIQHEAPDTPKQGISITFSLTSVNNIQIPGYFIRC